MHEARRRPTCRRIRLLISVRDSPVTNERTVSSRSFLGRAGDDEHFIVVESPAGGTFEQQLHGLLELYSLEQGRLGLAPESAIFRRVFLSDALNQAALVRDSALLDPSVAVSIVQQPPLPGSKIAILAQHVTGQAPLRKTRLSPRHLLVEKNGKRHLWSTRLC